MLDEPNQQQEIFSALTLLFGDSNGVWPVKTIFPQLTNVHLKIAIETTATTILQPFFQDHLGKPVPEETYGLYGARED